MAKRKQCSADKCRKMRVNDTEFCALHEPAPEVSEQEDPESACAVKIDPADAAHWGRLDAEIRNAILGQQVNELQIKDEATQLAATQAKFQVAREQLAAQEQKVLDQFQASKEGHQANIKQLKQDEVFLAVKYQKLIHKIATENDLDIKTIEIDPELAEATDLSFLA